NPVRSGYIFDGWYKAEVDGEGNPVYDDAGNLKITSEKADLTKPIKNGEHWYVCAGWITDIRLNIKLVSEVSITVDGVTYKSGDIIKDVVFVNGNATVSQNKSPVDCDGATFLQYYYDEACTLPFTANTVARPADGEPDPVLYAKFIKGNWKVVRTASDVVDMFNYSSDDVSYYFFNASGDKSIDMSGKSISLSMDDFNCQIEGNGFTIENLTFSPNMQFVTPNSAYSVFGQFGKTAVINNLTVKNLSVNVPIRSTVSSAKLYLISKGIDEGAAFNNFTIDGACLTVRISESTTIENIREEDGVFNEDNWIFGGVASGDNENPTDEAFLAKYSGVTVSDSQLIICDLTGNRLNN
ncbi:MAG: InlB B-repeat-containing protein, partial [Candidatus Coproplasma sp.]